MRKKKNVIFIRLDRNSVLLPIYALSNILLSEYLKYISCLRIWKMPHAILDVVLRMFLEYIQHLSSWCLILQMFVHTVAFIDLKDIRINVLWLKCFKIFVQNLKVLLFYWYFYYISQSPCEWSYFSFENNIFLYNYYY